MRNCSQCIISDRKQTIDASNTQRLSYHSRRHHGGYLDEDPLSFASSPIAKPIVSITTTRRLLGIFSVKLHHQTVHCKPSVQAAPPIEVTVFTPLVAKPLDTLRKQSPRL